MEAGFLGLLQGLTEFLPISSSAHLRIAGEFLPSGADPGAAFTAITQIGTEMAVLVYFWSDIMRIAAAWLRQNLRLGPYDKADARLGWLIIVGSVPIVLLGLLFKDAIEHSLRNLYITAVMLIVFGIVLGVADRIGKKRYKLNQLIWRDGILFGFAQAMALIPGFWVIPARRRPVIPSCSPYPPSSAPVSTSCSKASAKTIRWAGARQASRP